jgi:hypothetical protein
VTPLAAYRCGGDGNGRFFFFLMRQN